MLDFIRRNQVFHPKTYSIEEITQRLETPTALNFIKNNWNKLSAQQIANHLGISKRTVFHMAKGNVGKKKHIMVAKYNKKGILVFDNQTGIFYNSIIELAKAVNKKPTTMKDILNGKRKKNERWEKI